VNERVDLRIKITPTESVQWRADIAKIHAVLGRVPYKYLILIAVHRFAKELSTSDRKVGQDVQKM